MGVMNKVMGFLGLQEQEEVTEQEYMTEPDESFSERAAEFKKAAKNNVVSIHSQKNVRVMLTEPHSYDEAQEIADHLRSRRSVVVNLQRVRNDVALRIIDFLSGTVYALNGGISKLGPKIFLCTPDSVEIHGKITEIISGETDNLTSR